MIGFMNNKSQRTMKEVVMAYFKVLPQQLPGGTEENQEKPLSR
jgi:hypothetical protein